MVMHTQDVHHPRTSPAAEAPHIATEGCHAQESHTELTRVVCMCVCVCVCMCVCVCVCVCVYLYEYV